MNLIVATDFNHAIGKDNNLLEHFPSDLKYFKKITSNKVVVMGKNTYLSLPKRPLPNRLNIVLSSSLECAEDENLKICKNLEQLFDLLDNYNDEDIFVIGGSSIYSLLYPYCNTFYVTKICKKYEDANKYFLEEEEIENFRILRMNIVKENNTLLHFRVYKRFEV